MWSPGIPSFKDISPKVDFIFLKIKDNERKYKVLEEHFFVHNFVRNMDILKILKNNLYLKNRYRAHSRFKWQKISFFSFSERMFLKSFPFHTRGHAAGNNISCITFHYRFPLYIHWREEKSPRRRAINSHERRALCLPLLKIPSPCVISGSLFFNPLFERKKR